MNGLVTTIVAFVVALGVLITVHEFGHFWVARRLGIPCVALAGEVSASDKELAARGIDRAYSIRPEGMPLGESMRRASELLVAAAEGVLGDMRPLLWRKGRGD